MIERAQSRRNALAAGAVFGLTYGLAMLAINGPFPPKSMDGIASLIAMILVSGSVFGLLISLFTNSWLIPKTEDLALPPGENVEHAGLANHFLNFEARGGRLALTNTHLVFKPHAVNIQASELSIPRSEISGVEAVRTFGVVPNGLAVTLKSGQVEKFVVNDRKTWVAKLRAD